MWLLRAVVVVVAAVRLVVGLVELVVMALSHRASLAAGRGARPSGVAGRTASSALLVRKVRFAIGRLGHFVATPKLSRRHRLSSWLGSCEGGEGGSGSLSI